jgi:hypothetical protein
MLCGGLWMRFWQPSQKAGRFPAANQPDRFAIANPIDRMAVARNQGWQRWDARFST